jgi:Family of unknown function (DUF6807)
MSETRIPLSIDVRPDGLAVLDPAGDLVLRQQVGPGSRPFVHPINVPRGGGVLTEDAPDHHPWQHGLYIGLNDVNGVGFWSEGLHPVRGPADDGGFDSRLEGSATAGGGSVRWTVATDYLDLAGVSMLGDTLDWSLGADADRLELDLAWTLTARRDLTFGEYEYGGLFLRMPYRHETGGSAVDSEGQSESAKRARWVAVTMPLPDTGREAQAALLDHRDNPDSPVVWRIDNELGIGPSPSAAGAWTLAEGATRTYRYRLAVFASPVGADVVEDAWQRYAKEAV